MGKPNKAAASAAVGALKQDGPTVEEWVKAGYRAQNYPPTDYASRSTPEEIAAAIKAQGDEPGDDWNDAPDGAEAPAASEFDGDVKVRCIVHTKPHTHKRALAHGEEASVPPHVAELMLKRKQVELV